MKSVRCIERMLMVLFSEDFQSPGEVNGKISTEPELSNVVETLGTVSVE